MLAYAAHTPRENYSRDPFAVVRPGHVFKSADQWNRFRDRTDNGRTKRPVTVFSGKGQK